MTTMNPTQLWQYIKDNDLLDASVDVVYTEVAEPNGVGHFQTAVGVALSVEEVADLFHIPRHVLRNVDIDGPTGSGSIP